MRSEAVQRISSAYQLTAVVVTGSVLLLTHFSDELMALGIDVALALFVLWIWILMIRDARRATRRLRVVEARVNELLGVKVLTHETDIDDLWHRWGIL